ncbi:MAG TPA: hypothetical protein VIQ30_04880 [Pseudonocardia sp.]
MATATLRAELWAVLDREPQTDRDLVETVRNLRAELARRDTTIAAVRKMAEELAEAAPSIAIAGPAQRQIALALRGVLSAPVEATDPRADCGCCDGSWRLCRGLVDKGMARCCADCTHDLSAPVEAGTSAEPTGDTERGQYVVHIDAADPSMATRLVGPFESRTDAWAWWHRWSAAHLRSSEAYVVYWSTRSRHWNDNIVGHLTAPAHAALAGGPSQPTEEPT